jgi:hypothetical protein
VNRLLAKTASDRYASTAALSAQLVVLSGKSGRLGAWWNRLFTGS